MAGALLFPMADIAERYQIRKSMVATPRMSLHMVNMELTDLSLDPVGPATLGAGVTVSLEDHHHPVLPVRRVAREVNAVGIPLLLDSVG